jgi:hypothetical protein
MPPDDDLKAPFAELQRRRREQAPAFGPMRERALRKAGEAPEARRRNWVPACVTLAGAACAAVLGIWWATQVPRAGEKGKGEPMQEDVETLIAAIEQHLEADSPAVEYPTDLLLAGDSTDFAP